MSRATKSIRTIFLAGTAILYLCLPCSTSADTPTQDDQQAIRSTQTYTNSLGIPLADPAVFYEEGAYYLYGTDQRATNQGIPVWTSTDLVHWKQRGFAFRKTEKTWTQRHFWSPELVKVGDEYYLYFSASPNRDKDYPFNMHLCVAKAKSPLGPFEEWKTPFYKATPPDEAIDQSIFMDDDGQAYMAFTRTTKTQNEIWVARLKSNLLEIDGQPSLAITPTEPWEARPWNDYRVAEGSYLFKHNGYYYLLYSANHFLDPHYCVGYATSKSPLGPWKKASNNPVLGKTDLVHGPGHGMLIASTDGKETFFVYHTHCKPGQVGPRMLSIDRVHFKKVEGGPDILTIDGPTSTPQPMPSGVK